MHAELPTGGTPWSDLRAQMLDLAGGDIDWRRGRTGLYVFNAGDAVREVGKEAYGLYMSENGLAPLAFPSLKRMEDEVVGFGLALLNAPEGAAGDITSGGTDSIVMAMKTCRDWWRAEGRDTAGGEVLVPESAHPAFQKAAMLLGLEVVRVPLAADYRADPAAMAQAVTDRTLMIVGSAPSFPFGLVDPIEEIGAIAGRHGLWMHVDACVGGYFAPFAELEGVELPPWDFRVPAVRSMSADLHKYGYAPKGASTVLYRSAELREHQIFRCPGWNNGPMVTPTLAGTRPGGAIAAAWAVMRFLGVDGYREKAAAVLRARRGIEAGLKELGFAVLGEPKLGLIAFASPDADILAVSEAMRGRGWFSARLQSPPGMHLMLSPEHERYVGEFLQALAAALNEVRREGKRGDGKGLY